MKKLLLVAAMLFASFGAFAAEDTFDKFVDGIRKELAPQGIKVSADKAKRVLFIDFKLPAEVKELPNEQVAAIKTELVKELTKDADAAAIIKALKVTMVYNFILADGKSAKVTVTPADLEKAAAPAACGEKK